MSIATQENRFRRENRFRKIQDRLGHLRAKPSIGLYIDLDGILERERDFENVEDVHLSTQLRDFSRVAGRLVGAAVYYSTDVKKDGMDDEVWRTNEIQPVHTSEEGFTGDNVNLSLLFDAYQASMEDRFEVCMLVAGTTDYTALARRLIHRGISVVIVGNYSREKRVLPKDGCIYVPINSVLNNNQREAHRTRTPLDLESYDFTEFVQLLQKSQDMMPFVGAGYFVNKVMWRLQEIAPEDRQVLFQAAADRDVIEIYEHENIDGSENRVSACRLNPEHPLVQEVLSAGAAEDRESGATVEKVSTVPQTDQPVPLEASPIL